MGRTASIHPWHHVRVEPHELVAIGADGHEFVPVDATDPRRVAPPALGSRRDRSPAPGPRRPGRRRRPVPGVRPRAGGRAGAVARGLRPVARRSRTRSPTPSSGTVGWAGSGGTRSPAERFESFNLIHRNAILEMEPPHHTRLRRLISTAFARGHVERLRPWVEELAGPAGRRAGGGVGRLPAGRPARRDGRAAAGRRHRRAAGGARGRPAAAPALVQRDREDVRVRAHPRAGGRRRACGGRVRHLPARPGRASAGRRRATTWSATW